MKLLFALMLLCGAATAAPYQLDHTEVRDIRAESLKRDYQLLVALPPSYGEGQRRYPVVFVVDADYSFPVVRNIAQRLSKHAGLEETIVVGLSYAKGDTPVYSRRRDYTPSAPRKDPARSDMPGRPQAFGEARAYGRFIVNEVFPAIAAGYRADMGRKIFVGHSYGSLLGLEIALDQPQAFEHYILGSPSLWYDAGVMFGREQAHAAAKRPLATSLYFGIGGLETGSGKSEEDADMVADLRRFDSTLKSRRYAGLRTRLDVFPGEDHASVFPFVFTRGLRAFLKKVP